MAFSRSSSVLPHPIDWFELFSPLLVWNLDQRSNPISHLFLFQTTCLWKTSSIWIIIIWCRHFSLRFVRQQITRPFDNLFAAFQNHKCRGAAWLGPKAGEDQATRIGRGDDLEDDNRLSWSAWLRSTCHELHPAWDASDNSTLAVERHCITFKTIGRKLWTNCFLSRSSTYQRSCRVFQRFCLVFGVAPRWLEQISRHINGERIIRIWCWPEIWISFLSGAHWQIPQEWSFMEVCTS